MLSDRSARFLYISLAVVLLNISIFLYFNPTFCGFFSGIAMFVGAVGLVHPFIYVKNSFDKSARMAQIIILLITLGLILSSILSQLIVQAVSSK